MADGKPSCEIYRNTAAGKALFETLKSLVQDDKIPPQLAVKTMKIFDRCMYEALEKDAKENPKGNIKLAVGSCSTFKNLENVWTFMLENVDVHSTNGPERPGDGGMVRVKKLKVTAADQKLYTIGQ